MSKNGTTPDPIVQLGIVDEFEVDEIGLAALEEASPEFAKRAKERILNHNEYVESLNQELKDRDTARQERFDSEVNKASRESSAKNMVDTLTVAVGMHADRPEIQLFTRSDQRYRETLADGIRKRGKR
jgi:hypothetical protein